MPQKLLIAGYLLFATIIAHGAESKNISNLSSWLDQTTATGDWNGIRDRLENKGITISSYYATDIGGNPIGGLEQSLIYCGFLDVGIALDFEKIACLKGLTLKIANYLASGQNLSDEIGNFFVVQEVFTPGNYFFGLVDLSLSLLNDRVIFEIGRLLAGDVFAESELWQYYLTNGINGNFQSLEENIFFPQYNIVAWAARITYEPNKNLKLIGGIYDANPKVEDPDWHGCYFSLNMDKGYLALGQINFRHHQTHTENALPGSASFGGYYASSEFQDLDDITKSHRGNYGYYLIFDQMLFRGKWQDFDGPSHLRSDASYAEKVKKPYHQQEVVSIDRPQGLTIWGAGYFAPNENINIQSYQLACGLLYKGLFEDRGQDVTAFCLIRGKFSERLQGQEAETVVEVSHRFQLGPWFYITPDLQYIIKPNGQSDIPNALVLGLEMSIKF